MAPDVRALAAARGIAVVVADLGDWNDAVLVAEYDPHGPVIRLNARVLDGAHDARFVERAIAHELYHHEERMGRVAREPTHARREAAAAAYAGALVDG